MSSRGRHIDGAREVPELSAQYYELHLNRVRFREFVRMAYPFSFAAPLFWPLVKLRVFGARKQVVQKHRSIEDVLVDPSALPKAVEDSIAEQTATTQALGYVDCLCDWNASIGIDGSVIFAAAFRTRHQSGDRVYECVFAWKNEAILRQVSIFSSYFVSGLRLSTTNHRQNYDQLPNCLTIYLST